MRRSISFLTFTLIFLKFWDTSCYISNVRTLSKFLLESEKNSKREKKEVARIDSGTDKRHGRGDSIRQARFSRALRDEISEIIGDIDIKTTSYPDESLLRLTSVVDVEISSDLTYAKVFISVLGNAVEKRQVFVWLCENVGPVRYSLAKRLKHFRSIPDIYFKIVDNQASADLLNTIEESAPRKSGADVDFDFEEE